MSLSAFIEMCVDEKISKEQFKYATIVLSDEASKSDGRKGELKDGGFGDDRKRAGSNYD